MKTFVLIALVACVTFVTAIPVEGEPKNLNEEVTRQKRGWGYEPAITTFVPSPQIHTTVLGPSRTIVTAAHPPVVTTSHVVVPSRVATVHYPATTHSESYVWQSGPDHTYFVHQKHSPRTIYYTSYPTGTHILNTGPVVAW